MNLASSVIILFFLHTVRATLYAVFLWQLKEYRFDRMRAHLRTAQGNRWIRNPFGIAGWILLVFYALGFATVVPLIALYGFEALVWFWNRRLKRPIFTPKAAVIVVVGVALPMLAFVYPSAHGAFAVVIFDKLRAVVIAVAVLLLNRVTGIARGQTMRKAQSILASNPKLTVIGITGSYGKTSTKEFLAAILGRQLAVVKTQESVNTDIGVAAAVVHNLTRASDVFIAEIGAYKAGEIARIANRIKPSIGIITGINEQHLELFGSLEKTKQAKFELIESLPKQGVGIFNGDDAEVQDLIKKAAGNTDLTMVTYGLDKDNDVFARDIVVAKDRVSFVLQFEKHRISATAPVLGKQFVPNILAAAATAFCLHIKPEEIKKGIAATAPPNMTMAKVGEYRGATLIDDTFNANPAGVRAAIEYMQVYTGKKILVLTPLIELGSQAARIHQQLGSFAAKHCDYIILTNKNYYDSFRASLSETQKEKVLVLSKTASVDFLQKNLKGGDVVVFEGKETASHIPGMC